MEIDIETSDSRFLSSENTTTDYKQEERLRPTNFEEFIGQKRVIENILSD